MKTILENIIITEKSSAMIDSNKYTFKVNPNVNKIQIKQFFLEKYNVKVAKVNIVKIKGKIKRRGKVLGRTQDKTKAIVTLQADQNLDDLKGIFN
ncbi:50S ribosomal protein L23 [Candidatus Marinamargulisbacteria bacterium SCGC AG-410-N11]|nr:50S ribosomal protein L23 [Candidatus Marinamargulisbacteria bacterium SCGC AG-410-N11]